MDEADYRKIRPWVRMFIAIAYDIAFSISGRDHWSTKQGYVIADIHLTEFEQFPGSIERDQTGRN